MLRDKTKNRRHKRVFRHYSESGSEPGALEIHPDLAKYGTQLIITVYNQNELFEHEISNLDEVANYLKTYPVTWLRVYGLGNVNILQSISETFGLHKLAMEDVVHTHQRPKVEEYDDIKFAVTRLPYFEENESDLEQVSIFWGKNFVITFNERPSDCLNPLVLQIQSNIRRRHLMKPEFLTYSIIDTIVDSFFPILEAYGLDLDNNTPSDESNFSNYMIYNNSEDPKKIEIRPNPMKDINMD